MFRKIRLVALATHIQMVEELLQLSEDINYSMDLRYGLTKFQKMSRSRCVVMQPLQLTLC